nr:hypothetical protein [uncultured Desulfuromonas sp.]
MHEVHLDHEKNRLYLTISGVIDAEDALAIKNEVVAALDQLDKDFDVINDMSQADCGYVSCLPLFQEIITSLSTHGVRRVVRIVNDSVFHCQINAASLIFARYTILQASSLEEAEELLNEPVPSPTS